MYIYFPRYTSILHIRLGLDLNHIIMCNKISNRSKYYQITIEIYRISKKNLNLSLNPLIVLSTINKNDIIIEKSSLYIKIFTHVN